MVRRRPGLAGLAGLLLALGFWPAWATAEDWRRLPLSSLEGSAYYLDRDSLTREGGRVRVWERLVLNQPSVVPPLGPFQSSQFLMSYDCRRKSAALLRSRYFRDADSTRLIDESIRRRPRYLYVGPGSAAELKLDEVCALDARRR